MAQFLSKPFGMTPNGEKINEYIISNPGGLAVSVLNYGCIIKNIWVPTKSGPVDVVLGHDTYADYVKDFESSGSTCCGAFVAGTPTALRTPCSTWAARPTSWKPTTAKTTCTAPSRASCMR